MPSLFTSNGGIELPADGEQDGVWGDTVNTNMQIIDRLTNGVGAIALSGTTHTLTTLNGVLSDGHYSLIVFGGSPSGTNTVTIAPNDAEKTYLVRNTTTQSIVLTQGSGGDVTIASGAGAIVYADGTGTGAAVADLTATFIPDLSLAGITASTAELNILDGVTASTAELNLLDGVTATAAELNILDGVTASTAELNILDGVTATAAELNILDGVTASTAELNILDGVTATTAELNFVDGVTSAIQTQLDGKQPVDVDLTALAELSTSGIVIRTGTGTATTRSIVAGTAISVTNGNGVANSPTVAFEGAIGTVGVTATAANDGTFTTGTYTPFPAGGNFKTIVNGGNFTLAAPYEGGDYTLVIQITNATGAGVITLYGFTKTTGTTFTTVDTHKFIMFITKVNGVIFANTVSLQ